MTSWSLPVLDPEAASRKIEERSVIIQKVIRDALRLLPDADVVLVAHRYAMMTNSNLGFAELRPQKRTEQAIKRELEKVESRCTKLLKRSAESNAKKLQTTIETLSPEAGWVVPGIWFYLPELRAGTISRERLEQLLASTTQAIELIPAALPHSGPGRPGKTGASAVALMLASDYRWLVGEMPTFGGNPENGHSAFQNLVAGVFSVLGIEASAATATRKAVEAQKRRAGA